MNLSISIDGKGFTDKLIPIIENRVSSAISDTMDVVHDRWEKEARSRLNGTLHEYLSNIQPPNLTSPTTGEIELTGTLPNMIEKGFPSFDMKPGFAGSKKRKPTKDRSGWYLTIPIRKNTSRDPYGVAARNTSTGSLNSVISTSNIAFRRVSDMSQRSSWRHPGFKGINVEIRIRSYDYANFLTLQA